MKIEISPSEINRILGRNEASENYNPDKRCEAILMDFDFKDVFNPDKRVDKISTELDPYNYIPKDGYRGNWEGEPGDSKYRPDENNEGGPPSGRDAMDALSAKEKDGIEYHDGEPDFSEVAEATVEIEGMSELRYGPDGNFAKADQKLAEQYNDERHEGRNDWTARDIKNFRQYNLLTWHERQDCKSMDLLNRDIHQYFTHAGGVAVCKARNNSEVKFDE